MNSRFNFLAPGRGTNRNEPKLPFSRPTNSTTINPEPKVDKSSLKPTNITTINPEPKVDKSSLKPTNITTVNPEPKVDKSSLKPTNITVKQEPKVEKPSSKPENITIKQEPKVEQPSSKPENNAVKVDLPIIIPNCRVHLVGSKEAVEIANGDFSVDKLLDKNGNAIAMVIKVGKDLQWPLTKDEPVVKVNSSDYLFSLAMRGGHEPLSYGVSFVGKPGVTDLRKLDEFLKGNSCFSISDSAGKMKGVINWKEYAPKVDEFNSLLVKAIAIGTGHIVNGIFNCSKAYSTQVQKAGESIAKSVPDKKKMGAAGAGGAPVNVNLKRVRDVSKFIEEISKRVAEGMGIAVGSALAPVVQSEQGKKLINRVPGSVLLASQDALNRIMESVELAKKVSVDATTASANKLLSEKLGGDMEETTENVIATAENFINTAWTLYKMRKAMKPNSAIGSGLLLTNALRTLTLNKK